MKEQVAGETLGAVMRRAIDAPGLVRVSKTGSRLLRSGGPGKPADWDELVNDQGRFRAAAYDALHARRLLPGFPGGPRSRRRNPATLRW
jgi:hypothetical protein